jgi:hypothetical protein
MHILTSCSSHHCGYDYGLPFSCKGDFVESKVVLSFTECIFSCDMYSECQWYTYETEHGHCVLYKDCGGRDQTCTTCLTGNKCAVSIPSKQAIKARNYVMNSIVIYFLLGPNVTTEVGEPQKKDPGMKTIFPTQI